MDLRSQLEIPHDLTAIGIDEARLDRVGRMATEDPSAATNPNQFDAQRYSQICRAAIRGEMESI
ncbi:MAG: hypothetical protein CMO80_19920 [Verrucomicrobiales bacterium]|nr:hypothetical protein [Verrucomicrobiales bacterium]